MSNEAAQAQNGRPGCGSSSNSGWFHVLMELYRVNEQYIQEVVDASRKILQTVLEELVPGDHLKHAPVRTCFRILSGMIFILKVSDITYRDPSIGQPDIDRLLRWVRKRTTCVSPWICKTAPLKRSGRMWSTTSTCVMRFRVCSSFSLPASAPASCVSPRWTGLGTVMAKIAPRHLIHEPNPLVHGTVGRPVEMARNKRGHPRT